MRRTILIGTALVVLGAAAAAFAASKFNNYSGSKLVIVPAKAGSKAHPIGLGMTEILKASGSNGDRAAPLTNIKVTIFGAKLDVGKLPVCTDALIEKNKTSPTGGCPSGSVIGTGRVSSLLGPAQDPSAKGTACNPYLNVFNGGPKTQVFYFFTKSASDCAGLTTGATAPYDGHISYNGANAVINVPLPPDISTKVANQPNLYGSLISQTVIYPKKVAGKTYMASMACKGHKRPWAIQFTAHLYSGGNETQTVTGSSKC